MNGPASFGPNRFTCKDCMITLPIRLHFRKNEGKIEKISNKFTDTTGKKCFIIK